ELFGLLGWWAVVFAVGLVEIWLDLVGGFAVDEVLPAGIGEQLFDFVSGPRADRFRIKPGLEAAARPAEQAFLIVATGSAAGAVGHVLRHADRDRKQDFLLLIHSGEPIEHDLPRFADVLVEEIGRFGLERELMSQPAA